MSRSKGKCNLLRIQMRCVFTAPPTITYFLIVLSLLSVFPMFQYSLSTTCSSLYPTHDLHFIEQSFHFFLLLYPPLFIGIYIGHTVQPKGSIILLNSRLVAAQTCPCGHKNLAERGRFAQILRVHPLTFVMRTPADPCVC